MKREADDEEKPGAGDRHDDPVADEALTFFLKLRGATFDDALHVDFARWLRADPRNGEEFRAVEAVWGSAEFREAALAAAPPTLRRLPAPRPRRRLGARHLALAASLVLILAGTGAVVGPELLLRWEADLRTATGERKAFALPDGSSMMLNTASAAALDFEDGRRTVTLLAGEAFFDVRHDPARPFRVTARFGAVEVLGTAFDVRMDGEADEVILERGRVRVTSLGAASSSAELKPGEAVTAGRDALSPVRGAALSEALGWREGRIAFAERPLSDILSELGRYHAGSIVVANSGADRTLLSGSYRLDDVEGAVRMLAETAGLSMTRLPGGLIILL